MDIADRTRSAQPGKVPAFKFNDNSGKHVVSDECTLIAERFLDLVAAVPDEEFPLGLMQSEPGELSRDIGCDWDDETLLQWIVEWMSYNELASSHGGYRVC